MGRYIIKKSENESTGAKSNTQQREDDTIVWQCVSCGDNGVIHGWKGTPWDLSGPEQVSEFIAVIPDDVYQAVAAIPGLPRPAFRVIMRAAVEREDVLLTGTRQELDSLKSTVGTGARRARGRRKELFGRLLEALENPSGGEDISLTNPGAKSAPKRGEAVFDENALVRKAGGKHGGDAVGPDDALLFHGRVRPFHQVSTLVAA